MKGRKEIFAAFAAGVFLGASLTAWTTAAAPAPTEPAVTGIGGVFMTAEDPAALRAWYRDRLGIDAGASGFNFFWRHRDDPERFGRTVWSVFDAAGDYLGDGEQSFMVNYRVRDLDGLLERLGAAGVTQIGDIEAYWYGRFAWVLDGEGNRLELWEPVDLSPDAYDARLREQRQPR